MYIALENVNEDCGLSLRGTLEEDEWRLLGNIGLVCLCEDCKEMETSVL